MEVCWICGQPGAGIRRDGEQDTYDVECHTCGHYKIVGSLAASRSPIPPNERYRLSFWCRQRQLDGRDPPFLHGHSIEQIATNLPNPETHEKADIFLYSLGKVFSKPGRILSINLYQDYPLACAEDAEELKYYLRALRDRGFVEGEGNAHITLSGWERIHALEAVPVQSKQAFVAFKYSDEMLTAWRGCFGEAIEKAGFDAVSANFPDHNDRIDAKIVAEIKKSRFLVADVTGANTGVYFEAGLALGLGQPVIWTCRADSKPDMHFDTRQYNHILWQDFDDLQEQLYVRIVATI